MDIGNLIQGLFAVIFLALGVDFHIGMLKNEAAVRRIGMVLMFACYIITILLLVTV